MSKLKIVVFPALLILTVLAACEKTPQTIEQHVEPKVITLQVTPALEHWLLKVAVCANEIPDFGVFTQVLPLEDVSVEESDLILRLGAKLEGDPFVAVMGSEELVIVGSYEVPVSDLSLDNLQAIYTGDYGYWTDIPEAKEAGSTANQAIKIMSYPPGDEIESLFNKIYMDDQRRISPDAQYYLTVDFLKILLTESPAGLGYLLRSQVPEGLQMIEITGDVHSSNVFVLAITKEKPVDQLGQLLLCLQNVQQ